MTKIIDTVLYAGEQDMLECRLAEIGNHIDHMVVIEGQLTFTGRPRKVSTPPMLSGKDWKWSCGLVYFVIPADAMEAVGSAWEREVYARQKGIEMAQSLSQSPDDMVLIADVDEIPRRSSLVPQDRVVGFQMRHHIFNVKYQHGDPCVTSVYAPVHLLEDAGAMRRNRFWYPPLVDAGWHLSWFGTDAERINKSLSFSHEEMQWMAAPGVIAEMEATGEIWHGQELLETPAGLDWPEYIANGSYPNHWVRP